MKNSIQDNRVDPAGLYQLTIKSITTAKIEVTMSTKAGYDAVATGIAGKNNGSVTDNNGNSYRVNLPGFSTAGSLDVTFNRA